ncbi:hypothetical protein LJR129_001382 [Acidovorax sp. LjRoot129]|uniref:hypothetical protein n=1 Tax=Acidovorax sp. LjRoot129 TaxID=3342260 RepID=UPI003ECF5A11
MSIVTDFLTGIAEFVADVFLFRREREKRGSTTRGIGEDATAVAHFNFFTLLWISLVSVGVMALLIFGFDVHAGWGMGIGIVFGVVWGYWRYSQLVSE